MGKSLLKKLLLFLCAFFFIMPLRVDAKPLDEIRNKRYYLRPGRTVLWIFGMILSGGCWTVAARDL